MLPADDIQDPIDRAIRKFDSHPSVCEIKENTNTTFFERFGFRKVAVEEVAVQTRKLITNTASPVNSIPARILKETSDVFSVAIQNLFDSGLSIVTFPKELKAGDMISLFKKEYAFTKENYRFITVIPSVSKIYGCLMQDHRASFKES